MSRSFVSRLAFLVFSTAALAEGVMVATCAVGDGGTDPKRTPQGSLL
jgi:hypothetical protein